MKCMHILPRMGNLYHRFKEKFRSRSRGRLIHSDSCLVVTTPGDFDSDSDSASPHIFKDQEIETSFLKARFSIFRFLLLRGYHIVFPFLLRCVPKTIVNWHFLSLISRRARGYYRAATQWVGWYSFIVRTLFL